MRRTPAPTSPVMQALRALERAERRKGKPDIGIPTSVKKTAKPPRAKGGKTKKGKP